ncbi:hypothetical protein [Streptomyces sp. NPDC059906]|uniref:hypothetical protein n=1 Tax=Streptomyces sp. NPDC059906 TaxID=3346997 RepID=UPI003646BE85
MTVNNTRNARYSLTAAALVLVTLLVLGVYGTVQVVTGDAPPTTRTTPTTPSGQWADGSAGLAGAPEETDASTDTVLSRQDVYRALPGWTHTNVTFEIISFQDEGITRAVLAEPPTDPIRTIDVESIGDGSVFQERESPTRDTKRFFGMVRVGTAVGTLDFETENAEDEFVAADYLRMLGERLHQAMSGQTVNASAG